MPQSRATGMRTLAGWAADRCGTGLGQGPMCMCVCGGGGGC